MTSFKTTSSSERKELLLTEKGTLLITRELQNQINYLHKKVGAIEWSGILFYKKTAGDLTNPKDFVLRAESLYLMDIGSAAYTSAKMDEESVIGSWEAVNDDYSFKRGLIHTHHNMATFFSGTDMEELHESVDAHNYYLSFIVNFSGEYTARVAFVGKRTTGLTFKNSEDNEITNENTEELLVMIEMNVVREEEPVSDNFRNRYQHIEEENKKKTIPYARTYYSGFTGRNNTTGTYSHQTPFDWDDTEYEGYYSTGGYTPRNSTTQAYSTKGERFESTKEGNITNGDRVFKPVGKVQKEFEPVLVSWLEKGMDVFENMWSAKKLVDVEDYTEYFESFFENDSTDDDKTYFLDVMQRHMTESFEGLSAGLVQRLGCELITPHLSIPIAMDLYSLFDAYPQYVQILEESTTVEETPEANVKGSTNKNSSRRNNKKGK